MQKEALKDPNVSSIKPVQLANYYPIAREFLRSYQISSNQQADLQVLSEILQAFVQIPYENLSKIIKYNQFHQDLTSLRFPDEVWQDFRDHRLGGTCFSLTFFLQTILDFAGFSCYPVMARMKAGPNHHCALVVRFQNEHVLADPGYALDIPVPLSRNRSRCYRSAHSGVEMREGDLPGHFHLLTFNRENIRWRYEFVDVPTSSEIFLQHWLDSFTWNGMHGLCLTRIQKDSLIFVHNYFMRETSWRGKKNYNLKKNRDEVLQDIFGIEAEIVHAAQAALQENLQRESQPGTAMV